MEVQLISNEIHESSSIYTTNYVTNIIGKRYKYTTIEHDISLHSFEQLWSGVATISDCFNATWLFLHLEKNNAQHAAKIVRHTDTQYTVHVVQYESTQIPT
jgi:hypothetical protein